MGLRGTPAEHEREGKRLLKLARQRLARSSYNTPHAGGSCGAALDAYQAAVQAEQEALGTRDEKLRRATQRIGNVARRAVLTCISRTAAAVAHGARKKRKRSKKGR